eukprot:CAMPEP_0194279988 /NCGR_PEP_ID=MMETSP0169-20130528/14984_1 /TAXON_ID=218684 /ORGANISM="Corethron pennatum, Strain L29A3" /LENGTH=325 /DNA_ID=CAMNT_0039024525 /DNA_START=54 /DNA_END=1031 /DNA_ORIENTATION=-
MASVHKMLSRLSLKTASSSTLSRTVTVGFARRRLPLCLPVPSLALASATISEQMLQKNSFRTFLPALFVRREMSSASEALPPPVPAPVTFYTLNNISDNPGAIKKKRRLGRGPGSSKGKTSGRGHKGQKSRSGGSISPRFEGGQTPFYKRLPKRGFSNKNHATPMVPIAVDRLQDYIDMGRLIPPTDRPINMKDMVEAGLTKASNIKFGCKLLLGKCEISASGPPVRSPIRIEISRASRTAIEAIEAAGGSVTTVHYNRLALRALLKPDKFAVLPRRAKPPPKLMTYYTSYDKRGFLAPEVQLRDNLGINAVEKISETGNKQGAD